MYRHQISFLFIIIIAFLNQFQQFNCEDSNNDNAQTSATKTCPFSGTRYPLGESWFRRLDTHEISYCVACNCVEGGKSNCTSKPCNSILQQCSHDSDLSSFEKGCCQQCKETDFTKRVEVHVKSRIELLPKHSLNTKSTPITCVHNGRVYFDGQVFASNSSGIQKTQDNQCVQCICQGGLVLCRLKTCFANSCSDLKTDSDGLNEDCCPMRDNCQEKPISDEDNYKKQSHLVTFYSPDDDSMGNTKKVNPHDCKSGGRTYLNSAKWHPIIGPFGQMDCVICACMSGNVECSRINCPPMHKLSCSKPKRIQGQCCLICPDNDDVTDDDERMIDTGTGKEAVTTKSGIIHPRIGGTIDNGSKKASNGIKVAKENVICLPIRMDTIVYRSHAQSSISGYYQYAFQTKGTNFSTHLYSFTVKDGRIADFSEQHLNRDEYSVLVKTFRFKMLGATKIKFVEKFAKRTKKHPQRCSHRCKTRVERLERSLRLKDVSINRECQKGETEFN